MADMSKQKYKMPEQEPEIRNRNFSEVALGYTEELAIKEALRCLDCRHMPCVKGCPVNVDIPGFIRCIKDGEFEGAYQVLARTNSLPAVCGRVCPQETQCEELCVRALKGESVGIGRLERFAADWHMEHSQGMHEHLMTGQTAVAGKVAVVGAGPAGLTCAGDLAKLGYNVTVFEAFHEPGGVLTYGIPEFRLPKSIVKKEISILEELGVEVRVNMVIGKILSVEELLLEYDAVFIGTGAGLPRFMNIPGENLNGVYSANEFLTRINLMKAYKFPEFDTPIKIGRNVAVVGGGNVAMDAARSAKRLGAENVYIIYRRSEEELPARLEEVHHAKEEGIIFRLLENPVSIRGDEKGNVVSLECIRMELGEPDSSGRRRPVEVAGSEFMTDMDTVIIAIGQTPNPLIKDTTGGLRTARWGGIIVDEETMETSIKGVYAGGDIVTGAATVILAMGAGKKAAESIDRYIKEKNKG
ncbi:MAG: NADPH-dependent glutamate synthase [Clostridia bacterium]|nr:NADPH-dependent glutamate synthase [Clostridia bacterium]